MARVVNLGSRDEMRFSRAGSLDVERHNSILERARSRMRDLSGAAREGMSQLIEKVASVDIGAIRRSLVAAQRASKSVFNEDVIRPVRDIGAIQHLKSRGIRYNMASPRLLRARRNGSIEGYGNRFIDTEPDRAPEDRIDYMAVMTGMYDEDNDVFVTYMDVDDGSYDGALTRDERYDAQIVWEATESHLDADGSDPTSPGNHRL